MAHYKKKKTEEKAVEKASLSFVEGGVEKAVGVKSVVPKLVTSQAMAAKAPTPSDLTSLPSKKASVPMPSSPIIAFFL